LLISYCLLSGGLMGAISHGAVGLDIWIGEVDK